MNKNKQKKLFFVWAILVLIMLAGVGFYITFGGYLGRCMPGMAVNGKYYYHIIGSGVYEYTPGGQSIKLMKSYGFNDRLEVSEDGLYLAKGKEVYFYDFSSGEERMFFSGKGYDCRRIYHTIMTNGDVEITLYDDVYSACLTVLKGGTGEVVSPAGEWVGIGQLIGNNSFYIGDRHIVKNFGVKGNMSFVTLEENGANILPEDVAVYSGGPNKCGDKVIFGLYTGTYGTDSALLVLSPDGNDKTLRIPGYPEFLVYNYQNNIYGGYAFYKDGGYFICHDIHTGESWPLTDFGRDRNPALVMGVTMDENHVYTYADGRKTQDCWEIIRDNDGKPVELKLITDQIYK